MWEEFKCCQGKSRINETGVKWENEESRLVDITNTSQEIQFQEFVSTHDPLFRGKAAVNLSDFGVARYVQSLTSCMYRNTHWKTLTNKPFITSLNKSLYPTKFHYHCPKLMALFSISEVFRRGP